MSINHINNQDINKPSEKSIKITPIEVEAIKLIDIENLKNKRCAKRLKMSDDEFSDLVLSARKKIATSIIENIPITIEENIPEKKITTICKFRCAVCGETYMVNYLNNKIACPLCNSSKVMTNKEAGFCK
ncbi:DUF134 domain-containing protein [Romboutsia lituseburensis]|uniref:Uncharacterized protein n=1 Tax=Romboutsia lituseburensis DSM 797 TaxID=1121325 RepID=A0A1G9N0H4_9FIRM|nr:DUF134 domain-containing protein [Romboutsia lituseburensis]CEH34261.1 Protein of unknown function DUF134 [Romboutsia lituseburensis]SDL79375.1 Protein of unknown function DUF134 [Romboutsia lituseburensis DSM 797]